VQVPFTQLKDALQRHKMCKRNSPSDTSACFLGPKFGFCTKWAHLLRGMVIVKIYPRCSPLLLKVDSEGAVCGAAQATPWPISVYRDKPAPLQLNALHSDVDEQRRRRSSQHSILPWLVGGVPV